MHKQFVIFIFGVLLLQSCYFFGPSPRKRLAHVHKIKPVDVAIVPGLPLYHGTWDTLLKTRILWSVYLYKTGVVKNILYSGNAVYTKWVEGKAMAEYAVQLGVKREDILIDTLAEHSTENLYYGFTMAKAKGYKSIALATDPFQCAMLYKFSRNKIKHKVHFLPVVFDSIVNTFNVNPVVDTTLNVVNNFVPIEERANYKNRLKGTRGKNIK